VKKIDAIIGMTKHNQKVITDFEKQLMILTTKSLHCRLISKYGRFMLSVNKNADEENGAINF